MSGIVASGCGEDDTSGAGGSAGTGGSDGGAGKGGSGKGGAVSDAPTDVSSAQCRTAVDSGTGCLDACYCSQCPTLAYQCYANPECAVLMACISRTGCKSGSECQTACAQEIKDHPTGTPMLGSAPYQMCLMSCTGVCADAGVGGDARPDTPTTPDVRPDMSQPPDVTPDTTQPPPDVTPDNAPDVTPDNAPDAPLDVTPDNAPDAPPDNAPTDVTPDNASDAPTDVTPDMSDAANDAPG